MKPYFFISSMDGALHDTRDANWAEKPLRSIYMRHHARIENAAQFKATLRAGCSTDLGGYPLFLLMADNAALCFDCGRKEARQIIEAFASPYRNDQWRTVACEINHEDTDLQCAHCDARIPSAYGDD